MPYSRLLDELTNGELAEVATLYLARPSRRSKAVEVVYGTPGSPNHPQHVVA